MPYPQLGDEPGHICHYAYQVLVLELLARFGQYPLHVDVGLAPHFLASTETNITK